MLTYLKGQKMILDPFEEFNPFEQVNPFSDTRYCWVIQRPTFHTLTDTDPSNMADWIAYMLGETLMEESPGSYLPVDAFDVDQFRNLLGPNDQNLANVIADEINKIYDGIVQSFTFMTMNYDTKRFFKYDYILLPKSIQFYFYPAAD